MCITTRHSSTARITVAFGNAQIKDEKAENYVQKCGKKSPNSNISRIFLNVPLLAKKHNVESSTRETIIMPS